MQAFSNPFASSAPLAAQPPGYAPLQMRQLNDALAYSNGAPYGSLDGVATGNGGPQVKEDSLAWLFRDWMAPGFTASGFHGDERQGPAGM